MFSLKSFHIFFIVLSILLGAGFGIWTFNDAAVTGRNQFIALGVASVAISVLLTVYLIRFIAKMKKIKAHAALS